MQRATQIFHDFSSTLDSSRLFLCDAGEGAKNLQIQRKTTIVQNVFLIDTKSGMQRFEGIGTDNLSP